MTKKRLLLVVLLALFSIACTAGMIIRVFADGNQTGPPITPTDNLSWFSWTLFINYAAVGAFAGVLHDINDGKGLVILPHKTDQNTWDLGIISPALFGAFAGFFALAATTSNVPFLMGLFPEFSGSGVFAAAVAGYLYSKTIEIVLSKLPALGSPTTATKTPATS